MTGRWGGRGSEKSAGSLAQDAEYDPIRAKLKGEALKKYDKDEAEHQKKLKEEREANKKKNRVRQT